MRFSDITHPDDRQNDWEAFERVVRGEQPEYRFEKRYIRKDGSIVWVNVNVTVLRDADGQPLRSIAAIENITDRKRVEETLRQNETLLRQSQRVAHLGHYELDAASCVWTSSETLDSVFGVNAEFKKDVAGWSQILHSDDREAMLEYLREHVLKQGHSFDKQYRIVRISDGTTRWVHGLGQLLTDANGNVTNMFGTIQDITDRKNAEEAIEQNQKMLRSLASQVLLTEERERRKIAIQLHDHIGRDLTLAKMRVDAIASGLPDSKNDAMKQLASLIEQTIDKASSLTFELSSPILYELGLEAALQWLAEQTQREHGIDVSFTDDGVRLPVPEERAVLLFQVARELLFNVVKHAQASNAAVSVHHGCQTITLRISDDGQGFDTDAVGQSKNLAGGFGLFSIKERLTSLGGHVRVESSPGNGTDIQVTVPLH